MGYPELIKSEIKLTIGMLVSNHIQYIRKAMEALKPLLEAVPSELVVIDTKGAGTDGSIDVVREYTDRIYPFEWCNDFSAARNFCLDHARGEWFLYVDDDEWFDDVQEFIEFFQNGECEEYFSGYYYTRDYTSGGGYSMGVAGRMVRRTVNTRFVGKVHETFNEVYAPNKLFSCFTHHMGYLFNDRESRKKHQERNLAILSEELKEQGYQPRLCAQIVQELLFVSETAKNGLVFACESIEKLEKQGLILNSYTQWMLVATVRYQAHYGNYITVLKQADMLCKHYKLSQMALLVLAAVVIEEAVRWKDDESALQYAEIYLEQWEWLINHAEEALLQTQMDFPKYYTEERYAEILQLIRR